MGPVLLLFVYFSVALFTYLNCVLSSVLNAEFSETEACVRDFRCKRYFELMSSSRRQEDLCFRTGVEICSLQAKVKTVRRHLCAALVRVVFQRERERGTLDSIQ